MDGSSGWPFTRVVRLSDPPQSNPPKKDLKVGDLPQWLTRAKGKVEALISYFPAVRKKSTVPASIIPFLFVSPKCTTELKRIFQPGNVPVIVARKAGKDLWTEANVANAIISIVFFAQLPPAENPPLTVQLAHWLTVNQDIWDNVKPPALPRVIAIHPALAGGDGVVQIEIDRAMILDEVGWKMLGLPKTSRAKIQLTTSKFLHCAQAHTSFQPIRGLLPDTQ
jgi:hypothetical protein